MARLVLLHEKEQMYMLELDAPFKARDLPETKAAWLHEHREAILDQYRANHDGADPVSFN